ncbi:MAG: ABC transporter substrate-binding protein, partial [Burkholderiales bacterium]
MNKVFRIAATLAVLACSATIALAQQKVNTPIVGYLSADAAHSMTGNVHSLLRGLEELGYAEGKNIAVVSRHADDRSERLPDLVADLLRQEVAVIVTADPAATRAAKAAASSVPIVMVFDPDPVRAGFVASLARPGGNITGNTSASPGLIGTQMELLKVLLPKMSRIAVLGNPTEAGNPQALKEAETAARRLGLQLAPLDASDPKDIEPALHAAAGAKADAIMVLTTPIWILYHGRFMELVAERRLPAIYFDDGFVGRSGLMSYSVDHYDLNRRAAAYVVKILKGGKPADLPVEQPTQFHLSFNMETARKMELAVPQALLARVTNLIDGSPDKQTGNTLRISDVQFWALVGQALLASVTIDELIGALVAP